MAKHYFRYDNIRYVTTPCSSKKNHKNTQIFAEISILDIQLLFILSTHRKLQQNNSLHVIIEYKIQKIFNMYNFKNNKISRFQDIVNIIDLSTLLLLLVI
jgi:hypothetical protein